MSRGGTKDFLQKNKEIFRRKIFAFPADTGSKFKIREPHLQIRKQYEKSAVSLDNCNKLYYNNPEASRDENICTEHKKRKSRGRTPENDPDGQRPGSRAETEKRTGPGVGILRQRQNRPAGAGCSGGGTSDPAGTGTRCFCEGFPEITICGSRCDRPFSRRYEFLCAEGRRVPVFSVLPSRIQFYAAVLCSAAFLRFKTAAGRISEDRQFSESGLRSDSQCASFPEGGRRDSGGTGPGDFSRSVRGVRY